MSGCPWLKVVLLRHNDRTAVDPQWASTLPYGMCDTISEVRYVV